MKPCDCFDQYRSDRKLEEIYVHEDNQDRHCEAWFKLLELIETVAKNKEELFAPRAGLTEAEWEAIETLPPEISKLKHVKKLNVYGSNLVRIPPEIGEMESLEEFDPYTSYRLHWFPYEITRCKKLKRSRVSTRALYGNKTFRPAFPRLKGNPVEFRDPNARCSVCNRASEGKRFNQVWISLLVATDVLPLLAQTCSKECFDRLPKPAEGYIERAHKGGLSQRQPELNFFDKKKSPPPAARPWWKLW